MLDMTYVSQTTSWCNGSESSDDMEVSSPFALGRSSQCRKHIFVWILPSSFSEPVWRLACSLLVTIFLTLLSFYLAFGRSKSSSPWFSRFSRRGIGARLAFAKTWFSPIISPVFSWKRTFCEEVEGSVYLINSDKLPSSLKITINRHEVMNANSIWRN